MYVGTVRYCKKNSKTERKECRDGTNINISDKLIPIFNCAKNICRSEPNQVKKSDQTKTQPLGKDMGRFLLNFNFSI
jgi:hypothetical protein